MMRRGWRMWAEAKCDGQTNKQGLLYIDINEAFKALWRKWHTQKVFALC